MPRRRIADYASRFMRLYDSGLSDGKIGKQLGFSKNAAKNYRNKLGLPPHFKFGGVKRTFSEEEERLIRRMHSEGASILSISREIDASYFVVLEKCRELGLDTSLRRAKGTQRERGVVRVWEYLEDNGPTPMKTLREKCCVSYYVIRDCIRTLPDVFERFNFVVSAGRGDIKYGGYAMYGDLSYKSSGYIVSLRNDPRLTEYVADNIPFEVETASDAQTLVMHLKGIIGGERARQVVERKGYVYQKDRAPKEKVDLGFVLKDLYQIEEST